MFHAAVYSKKQRVHHGNAHHDVHARTLESSNAHLDTHTRTIAVVPNPEPLLPFMVLPIDLFCNQVLPFIDSSDCSRLLQCRMLSAYFTLPEHVCSVHGYRLRQCKEWSQPLLGDDGIGSGKLCEDCGMQTLFNRLRCQDCSLFFAGHLVKKCQICGDYRCNSCCAIPSTNDDGGKTFYECKSCDQYFCSDCLKMGTCDFCDETPCSNCFQRCEECEGYACCDCIGDNCGRCGVLTYCSACQDMACYCAGCGGDQFYCTECQTVDECEDCGTSHCCECPF